MSVRKGRPVVPNYDADVARAAGKPSLYSARGGEEDQHSMSDVSNSWKLLQPHVKPQLPNLVLVSILGAVSAAAQTVVLLLFQPIWDLVLFPDETAEPTSLGNAFVSIGDWLVAHTPFEDARLAILCALVGFALTMALIAASAQYGFTYLARFVGYGMVVDLRVRLARHLMGLSVRYHSERRFGDLLSRVSSDVTTTLTAINVGLKSLVQEPLFAVGTLAVAAYQAPWATLGILLVLPLVAWPVKKLSSRVRKGSTKSMTSLGSSVQVLSQMFQGIRTVKSFGGEERELERYRDINESYLRTSMRMVRAIAMTHAWTAFYSVAGFAVLVGALGTLAIQFQLFQSGGDMTVFFLAIARLNNHVKIFTKALTRVQESVGASQRIYELLAEPVDLTEAQSPVSLERIQRGLRFENVSFRYPGAESDAISELSLEIKVGETLALVGSSGAGKSTLMDLVARFVDPTAGKLLVDDVELKELSIASWTAQYALVGQSPFLFHASVGENIRYGRPEATQSEVEEAARAAGIHEFLVALPDGYDTDVADMGARLSGGQKQRITIARALLKGAPLLLLDEATSSLDSESEVEVQAALDRLMADRTVLVIAHRLSTIQNADRIAVLEEGRLVEIGRHEDLLRQGGRYANLHALQQLDVRDKEIPRAEAGVRE